MISPNDENCLSLKDIQAGLKKCNFIKYAAYRTAAKLRGVQKALFMDKVSLRVVSNIFERHQLQQTENSVQLDQKEVSSVLSDIYFVIAKENEIPLSVDYVSELMLSVLMDIFDKKMANTLQVFSFKVGLTILCQAKPREKYHYFFEQLADHNNCLSKKKLEILLKKMINITEHLGEALSFGSELIPGTVESCFKCNIGTLGISEDAFMTWLMQDPQLLVWLSTFYRMQISESVSHNAKCGICKICPVVGLRYRCLRCLSFDMCQSCFFTGRQNKRHKLKHPVQEYCCPMTTQQSTKAFLLTLRNRLYRKDCKLQYLPALKVDSCEMESLGQSTRLLDELETTSRTVINGSRVSLRRFSFRELHSIILHLERESEKIFPHIDNFCQEMESTEANEYKTHLRSCLLKHKAQVKAQLQRLNLLRNYLTSKERFEEKAFLASTPVVDAALSGSEKRDSNGLFENFSPITVRSFKHGRETDFEKKMMWDNYDLVSCGLNPSWEEVKSSKHESHTFELSQKQNNEMTATERMPAKDKETELELSTWLGGKTLREVDSSSMKGFSWLRENEKGKLEDEKTREEHEDDFEDLQSDLREVLNKLQELSLVTYRGEPDEGGMMKEFLAVMVLQRIPHGNVHTLFYDFSTDSKTSNKSVGIDMVAEVDMLLVDLISGMEKLMRS